MKRKHIVLGVGINDSTHTTHRYLYIGNKRKLDWICPYYVRWRGMLERVYCEKYHTREPAYRGSRLYDDWHVFSNFYKWMYSQDWENKELDKDILSGKHKMYSPETCIFIPKSLNQFLKDRSNDRGPYLLGVSKVDNRYVSRCSDPFKRESVYLGCFESEVEAHNAWKKYKHKLSCAWADILDNEGYRKEVGEALRNRFI